MIYRPVTRFARAYASSRDFVKRAQPITLTANDFPPSKGAVLSACERSLPEEHAARVRHDWKLVASLIGIESPTTGRISPFCFFPNEIVSRDKAVMAK